MPDIPDWDRVKMLVTDNGTHSWSEIQYVWDCVRWLMDELDKVKPGTPVSEISPGTAFLKGYTRGRNARIKMDGSYGPYS